MVCFNVHLKKKKVTLVLLVFSNQVSNLFFFSPLFLTFICKGGEGAQIMHHYQKILVIL